MSLPRAPRPWFTAAPLAAAAALALLAAPRPAAADGRPHSRLEVRLAQLEARLALAERRLDELEQSAPATSAAAAKAKASLRRAREALAAGMPLVARTQALEVARTQPGRRAEALLLAALAADQLGDRAAAITDAQAARADKHASTSHRAQADRLLRRLGVRDGLLELRP
ncbi:MAG: hypothetical protein KBG28_09880 [Kofleriaceae bacterium]|nr:hypothetical protein [Kofleriaceae bacterium]MBP9204261.1 hypothetical protein [Kofleriaceae bacterium]